MKNSKKGSVIRRWLAYITVVIMLSNTVLFLLNFLVSRSSLLRQSEAFNTYLMESNIEVMETYFEDIDGIAASIIFNTEIIDFLRSPVDTSADLKMLENVLRLYYHSRSDLQLILYKEGNYDNAYSIYVIGGSGEIQLGDYRESKWFRQAAERGEDRVIVTEVYSEYPQDEDQMFLHTIVYTVRDYYSDEVLGYLRVNLDLNYLKERFIHDSGLLDGTAIYDTGRNLLFYDQMIPALPEGLLQEPTVPNQPQSFTTREAVITYATLENTGWWVVFSSSTRMLFQNQTQILVFFLVILLCVLLLTVLLSQRLFSKITANLKRLIDGMRRVKHGELQTQLEVNSQDEIGELLAQFNDMVLRIDTLVTNVEAKQILLKEAEIKALQQQINPHFIFNIMETIIGLASEDMTGEVIEVCKCMSAMLRFNISFSNTTTLRNELEQVENYLRIIAYRFGDRFAVQYNVDEACLGCEVVRFMLQPLVENAVTHGFANIASGGELSIIIEKEEGHIHIRIADNGAGIEAGRLAELQTRMREVVERPLEYIDQYKSLGLLNVHLRLKMFYAEGSSMQLTSRPGQGTCFDIRVPFRLAKETSDAQGIDC